MTSQHNPSQQLYPNPGNQYPGSPQTAGYNDAYPQAPHQLPGYPPMQQRRPPVYRKGPSSHSSGGGGSSSCASSSRDQFGPVRPSLSYGQHHVGLDYHDQQQYDGIQQPHHPSYAGRGNRRLSGVVENEDGNDMSQQYYEQAQHQDREMAPLDPNNPPPANPAGQNAVTERDSSDMSTSSMRATSCDSGLPVDDVEGHSMDPKVPLVARNMLRNSSKNIIRGPTPRQFVWGRKQSERSCRERDDPCEPQRNDLCCKTSYSRLRHARLSVWVELRDEAGEVLSLPSRGPLRANAVFLPRLPNGVFLPARECISWTGGRRPRFFTRALLAVCSKNQ